MEKLDQEILESIGKHLPAMQVEALGSKLNAADQTEKDLENARKECAFEVKLRKEADDQLRAYVAKEKQLAIREADAKRREEALTKKELDFALADTKVSMTQDKCNTVVELAKIMFGKQAWTTTRTEDKQVPMPPSGGYMSNITERTTVHTETNP
jgi:hypothetical protein